MFDENGILKPEYRTLRHTEAGTHGYDNFASDADTPTEAVQKYLRTVFENTSDEVTSIRNDNSSGSGVRLVSDSYSTDSARLLLLMLARQLGPRRMYRHPKAALDPVALNEFGQKGTYDFKWTDPSYRKKIKSNPSIISEITTDENGVVSHNGVEIGRFRKKTPEEILSELNRIRDMFIEQAAKTGATNFRLNEFTYNNGHFYFPDNMWDAIIYKNGGKTKKLIKK